MFGSERCVYVNISNKTYFFSMQAALRPDLERLCWFASVCLFAEQPVLKFRCLAWMTSLLLCSQAGPARLGLGNGIEISPSRSRLWCIICLIVFKMDEELWFKGSSFPHDKISIPPHRNLQCHCDSCLVFSSLSFFHDLLGDVLSASFYRPHISSCQTRRYCHTLTIN